MPNVIPLTLAALIAVGIIVIGTFYLAFPERISGTFGLKPPASDADTLAWLRPKGIRDVVSGLVVLTLMLTADRRLVGIAVLVYAIIPFGDMSIVLGSGGSKSRAFSVHGVTCAVMLVVGLVLILPCERNASHRSMAPEGWGYDRALGRIQSAGSIRANRRGDG
jgi:hypothetical protein